jgi:hypothetical protein
MSDITRLPELHMYMIWILSLNSLSEIQTCTESTYNLRLLYSLHESAIHHLEDKRIISAFFKN